MSSKPKQANWKTSTLDGRSNLENLQRILLEAKGAIKADAIKQTEYFRNLDITAQQISNKLNQTDMREWKKQNFKQDAVLYNNTTTTAGTTTNQKSEGESTEYFQKSPLNIGHLAWNTRNLLCIPMTKTGFHVVSKILCSP
jgi:hypothetical protein